MQRDFRVMVKSGLKWVKLYEGSYDSCQWFSSTQRHQTRVEPNF